MKRWIPKLGLFFTAIVFAVMPACAHAQFFGYTNYCQAGGQFVFLSGMQSSTKVQASYPQCVVTVYLTGTITKASIYSNSTGTVLANPFVANTDGSFLFFSAGATAYDVTITSGGLPSPHTFTAVCPACGGGGGGSGLNQLTKDVLAGPGTGSQVATVVGVQSNPIANTSPVNSAVLVWDTSIYDVRQLTQDDIAPGFSILTFGGAQTVEIGLTVTNPAFTASYSSLPISANITNTDSIDSPLALTTPFTSGTVTGSFRKIVAACTTFTLTAISTSSPTKTQLICWEPRTFGGVGTAGATATVTASGNNALLSTGNTINSAGLNNQSQYGPFTTSGQKIYILMIGGTHTFKDANTGFSFAFNTPTSVSFINQNGVTVTMFLYESTNTLTGTFTVAVSS